MPDYQSYPTWQPGADEYNVDPETLPISKELADELNDWGDDYDATLVLDDPASSGFPDAAAEEAFADRGARLARRLAAELTGRYRVEYHDVRTGRREEITG
ncbi:hypothetical protein ODJ79_11325 [Actinoplanes sp. KI2]|uniref:hypothetical protein n=1 Tax=Actinoplanes sp. KI2 TaxID=2983315 RepID=UPI0021D5AF34|nr:hypothetical protein [Actinoplanes sp. KI2]MCU7724307.1 hypothetical protein [Actinoplanes sp. KI2]